ncbi:MAG TPA: hypothetical protein VKS19_04175 [Verrucomicrobiae bacterium]|nr:hypothetical protein [Verrucomicrobiae bacterium]
MALYFCLFLSLMQISAQNWVSPFPIPPMQSAPWSLSSTNLPPGLQNAVNVLFQTGMADPRGCDYREIEVVIGNFWTASGTTNKTHGWLLPVASGSRTNYAIGWNGLLYPVVSVGNPANAEDDARALIRAMTPPAIPNKVIFDVGVQTYVDEDYSLNVRWLTPAKAAMIFRFASPGLVGECAQLFPKKDPFLALSTGFLWATFDRCMGAHMRGDDDLAYVTAITLDKARKSCEAEAKARGFELQPTPLGPGGHAVSDAPKREYYFPFLKTFPPLLQDQERRHQRKTPPRDPAAATNKEERTAALIDQLENVSARQTGRYAADYSLTGSPTVQALISEGWDAIEPLLNCYENDERLTRIIPVSHSGERTDRMIVDVRSAAYAALEGIIETLQFAPQFSGKETLEEKNAIYTASASAIRSYFEKYRGLSRAERLYQILKDDHGQWLETASIIVQATNKPIMPLVSWGYPWDLPLNLEDTTPMLGEPLRARTNPSVTELLIKRIEDTLDRGKDNMDDAGGLEGACDLAFCFAKWDPEAALKTIQTLSALTFEKLAPTNYRSFVSHMDLAGQLPELVMFREKAGDTNALREYALWLKSIEPNHFFLEIDGMLNPLKQFPDAPAWTGVWEFLFDDEQSAWFNYLRKQSTPDPTNWSSPSFNVGEYFGTPFINKGPFRKFVIRLLHDKSACGKIVGEAAHGYWLDQRLSTMRRYGYTVQVPEDGSEINGMEFRTCDLYAWLLSNRIEGAPAFKLYWPESRRDEAIAAIEKMLKSNRSPFKTHPFQER